MVEYHLALGRNRERPCGALRTQPGPGLWETWVAYGRGWARDLAELRREFPGFQIWQEVTGERARSVAVRRWPGTSPHTVVTDDPAELRAVLGERPPAPAGP